MEGERVREKGAGEEWEMLGGLGGEEGGREAGREVVMTFGPARCSPSYNPAKGHTNSSGFHIETPCSP